MSDAPLIEESSLEERRAFIKEKYPCISDCDMCGLCKVFHGKDPEQAYADYIVGNQEPSTTVPFFAVCMGEIINLFVRVQ